MANLNLFQQIDPRLKDLSTKQIRITVRDLFLQMLQVGFMLAAGPDGIVAMQGEEGFRARCIILDNGYRNHREAATALMALHCHTLAFNHIKLGIERLWDMEKDWTISTQYSAEMAQGKNES